MELFEPILHFFAQRWVHNIIWAGIFPAIGTAVAAKVASKTLYHLLNRDDNPLPFIEHLHQHRARRHLDDRRQLYPRQLLWH